MLTVKPWRTEALIRLALGVAVCVFMGVLSMSLLRLTQPGIHVNFPLFSAVIVAGFLAFGLAFAMTRRPFQLEEGPRRLMIFLACLYLGLALVGVAQKLTSVAASDPGLWQMVIAGVSFQGSALVLIGLFLREHQLSWAEGFGFRNGRGRAVLLGLLATSIVLPVAWLLQMGVAAALAHFHFEADAQVAVQLLHDAPTWLDRVPLAIVAIVLAPPAEEMLFRGLLYPAVKDAGFPRLALWGTTLLFAAIHWNILSFLSLVLLALVLTWLYETTNNLLAPIAAHSLFNTLNFAALQLYERVLDPLR
jgi:membrane protease YdiL (CAAX protease family)